MVGRQQGADDEAAPAASPSTTARSSTRRRSSSTSSATRRWPARTAAASCAPVASVDVRRPVDGAAEPVGAVLAAARRARRSRRHDGLAEGGAGRRRQVRHQAGVLGPVQVRRARRAGPHRASSATPNYWNKAAIHFDKVVYTPIPDATVRLANLRSGQLDFIERVAPSRHGEDLKSDSKLKIARITEIGYQGITINAGKSEQAQKNPLGRDPRVREAFELSLDRARHRAGRDGRRGDGRQPVGRAEQRRSTRRTCRSPSATSRAPRRC